MSCKATVGICAYNEERNIGKLLSNIISDQGLHPKSEVIVVCSGCTDNTVKIVQGYTKADTRVKMHIEKERRGKTSAINVILSAASCDSIIFVSGDTLPKRDCFPRLISKLQKPNVGVACGNPVPTNSKNSLVGKLVQMLWGFHDHVFAELNDAGLARHATEVFCIRKGIVDRIPDETVNDDAYMAISAKKKGWLVKFEREAQVLIHGPETFPEYFNQRRRILWGHKQVKKLTGEPPQHLAYLLPLYPLRVLRLILWLFSKYSLPSVSAFVSTELLVNASAIIDWIRGKSHSTWSIATSTKRVTQLPT